MTLNDLPKFEMFEEGSQIRRSVKSVKSNIVEGYGRKNYKQEYLHFLTIAIASNDESIDHLETLFKTGSFKDNKKNESLFTRMNELGRKLNLFFRRLKRTIKVKNCPYPVSSISPQRINSSPNYTTISKKYYLCSHKRLRSSTE